MRTTYFYVLAITGLILSACEKEPGTADETIVANIKDVKTYKFSAGSANVAIESDKDNKVYILIPYVTGTTNSQSSAGDQEVPFKLKVSGGSVSQLRLRSPGFISHEGGIPEYAKAYLTQPGSQKNTRRQRLDTAGQKLTSLQQNAYKTWQQARKINLLDASLALTGSIAPAAEVEEIVEIFIPTVSDPNSFEGLDTTVVKKADAYTILRDSESEISSGFPEKLAKQLDDLILPRLASAINKPSGHLYFVITDYINENWSANGDVYKGFVFPTIADTKNNKHVVFLAAPQAGSGLISAASGLTEDDILMTACHETLHSISFYTKVASAGKDILEVTELDEGMAHLLEDLCGYQHLNNISNVQAYLDRPSDYSVFGFKSGSGGSSAERGAAYLWLKFLFDRKGGIAVDPNSPELKDTGGIAFLRSLVNASSTGFANLTAATGRDFNEDLVSFALTVLSDNTDLTPTGAQLFKTWDDVHSGSKIGLRTNAFSLKGSSISGPGMLDASLATEGFTVKSFGFTYLKFTAKKGKADLQFDCSNKNAGVVVLPWEKTQ